MPSGWLLAALVALLGELWYLGVLQKGWHELRARATPAVTQSLPAKTEEPAAKPEAAKVEAGATSEPTPAKPAEAKAE